MSLWAGPCTVGTATVSLAPTAQCSPPWPLLAQTIPMREAGHAGAGYQRWQSNSTAPPSYPGLASGTPTAPPSFRILGDSARRSLASWVRLGTGPATEGKPLTCRPGWSTFAAELIEMCGVFALWVAYTAPPSRQYGRVLIFLQSAGTPI